MDILYESIAHHGIDGMKWGVRNGPPYPLERYRNGSIKKKTGSKGIMKNSKDELDVPKIKSEHSREYDADVATRFARWVSVDSRRKRSPMSEVAGASAYELRRRGYDVYAEPYVHTSWDKSPIETLHRQFEFERDDIKRVIGLDQRSTRRRLREELLKQGENARGVIIISGNKNYPNKKDKPATKYQVLSYENGDNGQVYYMDPVTGRFGEFLDYQAVTSSNKIINIQYCRLDDKKAKDYRKNLIYDASSHKDVITETHWINDNESRDVVNYDEIKKTTELLMAADKAAKEYIYIIE